MIRPEDRNRDMEGSRKAMIRAARHAADLAKQHGQPLLLWRDGRIVKVNPDELPELPEQTPEQRRNLSC